MGRVVGDRAIDLVAVHAMVQVQMIRLAAGNACAFDY